MSKDRIRDRKRLKKDSKYILELISSKNYHPMREKDIADLLEIPRAKRIHLRQALERLEEDGKVEKTSRGRYIRKSLSSGRADRRKKERPVSGKKQTDETELSEMDRIVLSYGIPSEFPERVLRQANRCPDHVLDADLFGRKDLREWQMVTIDGEDSKDLDDAVSLSREGEYWRLGVHIADVSNYVQGGSALDKEALKRGTSVYLCDRVIPMLPKKLSNEICSLNEGEDRLALSCIMKIDSEGRIVGKKIAESVIRVDRRMTYEKVDRLFEEGEEAVPEYREEAPMLQMMRKLAGLLRKRRVRRGAILFDFPETEIRVDENGVPVDVYAHSATEATGLIEEFMLAANETVAKTYYEKQVPFVYRVHEDPDPDQIEETLSFIRKQGLKAVKSGRFITPGEVNQILDSAKESPKYNLISTVLLRSMRQARYSKVCSGHFGLAAKYYCHFTSPIRRYPDLQIHRIIKDDLRGRLHDKRILYYDNILDDVAWKSSALERRAVEVERETNKLKLAEYVQMHLQEEYAGLITGVTGWGIYVQLPNTIEGLVPMRSIADDYYIYEEDERRIVGKRHGRVFQLGDRVRVRILRSDPSRRIIDFELAEEEPEPEKEEEDEQGKGQQADCQQ